MEVSKEIQELALKFVESEEMREYFRNTLLVGNICTRLRFDPKRDCRKFIVNSRSGINDKLGALRKLPPDKETSGLIQAAESALAELKASKDNVFLTTVHYPYDLFDTRNNDTWDERKPFLSFESVQKYVKEQTASECENYKESLEQCVERVWYEVEKYIPDEANELKHRITWTLNAKGEIMFFELGWDFNNLYYSDEEDEYSAWWDWKGNDWTYPPVPFDFGDIITIDMRPFYEDLRGVIVHIGDNSDCCAIGCIYCDEKGNLYYAALKHNLDHQVLSKISPLYRAERFKGELPENEQALGIISEAIKKMPSFEEILTIPPFEEIPEIRYIWRGHKLAERFGDFLTSDDYEKQRGRTRRSGLSGRSWDEFRKKFGL